MNLIDLAVLVVAVWLGAAGVCQRPPQRGDGGRLGAHRRPWWLPEIIGRWGDTVAIYGVARRCDSASDVRGGGESRSLRQDFSSPTCCTHSCPPGPVPGR